MATIPKEKVQERLGDLPGWSLGTQGALERNLKFDDFKAAMAFINQVADAAEAADHHPDIEISYNKVRLKLVSHDVGGITDRDFNMATRINKLRPPQ